MKVGVLELVATLPKFVQELDYSQRLHRSSRQEHPSCHTLKDRGHECSLEDSPW